MHTSDLRLRAVSAAAPMMVAATLLLGGCKDIVEPSPSPSDEPSLVSQVTATAIPSPSQEDESPEPSYGAFAQVTIAEVDPDGLNATLGGFVTEVAEDGGACTFSVTDSSGATVDVESVGVENVGSTSCGSVSVPVATLHRGEWTVVLTYTSATTTAASEPIALEVP